MAGNAFELPPSLLARIDEDDRRVRAERARAERRNRAKRLCGLAMLAVDTLRQGPPALAREVEAIVHDVGAGVEALASYELVARRHEQPSTEQRRAVAAVIDHAPLAWALDKVEKLVRQAERAQQEAKRR
jgi:hypothetical protein